MKAMGRIRLREQEKQEPIDIGDDLMDEYLDACIRNEARWRIGMALVAGLKADGPMSALAASTEKSYDEDKLVAAAQQTSDSLLSKAGSDPTLAKAIKDAEDFGPKTCLKVIKKAIAKGVFESARTRATILMEAVREVAGVVIGEKCSGKVTEADKKRPKWLPTGLRIRRKEAAK